ncbi:MAG: rRNA maturation RNase YbeY [Bacteroidetes bacterium]|nr:rRNA maturation RNase YbeY [Bacteroidota bacterium]
MNTVFFHNIGIKSNLKQSNLVKKKIKSIFDKEKTTLNRVDYIFCSDKYLLDINRQFLQHDEFTDTITFTLSEKQQPIIGEIYISIERIKENAKIYNVPYQNELLRVMIHSALHLCGYEDNSKSRKKMMHERENYYLKL